MDNKKDKKQDADNWGALPIWEEVKIEWKPLEGWGALPIWEEIQSTKTNTNETE